jgi:hypothetical protein
MTITQIQKAILRSGFQYSKRSIQRWLNRRKIPFFGPSQRYRFYDAKAVAVAIEEDFGQGFAARPKSKRLLTVQQLQGRASR